MKFAKGTLLILGAYICTLAVFVAFNIIINLSAGDTITIDWDALMITAAIVVGTQTLFVLPLVRPPQTAQYGKSLTLSFILAAVIASLCSTALIAFVYSFVVSIFLDASHTDDIIGDLFIVLVCCSWIVWSALLLLFVRRKNKDARQLVRWTGWLFAGSLVEFLLSIPLTIMVARRSDCYCETGSFFSLVFSLIASFWLFGPCLLIVLFWRKRPWCKDHCLSCGYPRKVGGAKVCSECGKDV
jgi:hypothetical protein